MGKQQNIEKLRGALGDSSGKKIEPFECTAQERIGNEVTFLRQELQETREELGRALGGGVGTWKFALWDCDDPPPIL